MQRAWRISLLAASSLLALVFFSAPTVAHAKVLVGNGLDEPNATITDKRGKVYSHTEVLNKETTYIVKYKWSIDRSIAITAGDTMHFYLPHNIYMPVDAAFPMSNGAYKTGDVTVPKGSYIGTVTFNNVLSNTSIIRSGFIALYVSGAGEESGGENPGGENPGGETPGGENPGGENPGGENPGGENPGGETPGGENPGGGSTPGVTNPGGGGNTGGENPGGETPGIEGPGTEVPGVGTETPGVTNPGTEGPTNELVPGTTNPGKPSTNKPGVSVPAISGGSGNNISGANATSTQKPGVAASQNQQSVKPSVAASQADNGSQAAAAYTNAGSSTLPQTNEKSNTSWAVLGLGLLGLSLGAGYYELHQRKER
ncbi:LPXTG cell wall anchor domain-containing protein [Levilactobacillus cerevisiae]|uniref:LPXTG cell wall anchor domain-containing protein n=1 Tax=Levilactobacillus cerevisiae TaxID=1704076 RepID=UPI00345EAD47